ncbi:DUF4198 domain-containing protein [uncultured Sphingomonas sp.]|uniref:DUF4198 domain-containing protein n=1 Tax=uncultured Sphingomonas sp. TaxID=158754 RepID=UPI002627A1AF|nr:DUF4198 domain-containing protein [uncultured Sphingomonas sp.]
MKIWMFAALCSLSATGQAHEVWIERDGTGPARIYLGEPAQPMPAGGDPEFKHLKAPHLSPTAKAPLQRRAGYLEAMVPAGDVRAWDDAVFAPWGEANAREGVVYYARAGRGEAKAALPLELAPVTVNGDRFVLTRDGAPVADTEVTIIAPDKTSVKRTTDAGGMVDAAPQAKGRYLLVATVKDDGARAANGETLKTLYRITTTSFVVP